MTGGSGRLGKELIKLFPECVAPSREEMDVTSYGQVASTLFDVKPDVIVHCAALTDVAFCERNHAEAYRINVNGTANLVSACKALLPEVYFVYVSTACVFKGDKACYSESDSPEPKNYYGYTKMLGENVVSSLMEHHLIVRTNFVARETWPYPRAFVDRFGTYLFADDVARGLKHLVDDGMEGVVHVCGDRRMSMFELAKMVSPDVEPMGLKDYCGGVPLTVNMCLRSVRIPPFKITLKKNAANRRDNIF